MNPSYKPGHLVLTKQEIMQQFDIAIQRLQKSPGNFRFVKEMQLIKFLISRTGADKFPYYWMEINKIFQAVTTLNDLRQDAMENPKITPLAKLAEVQLQQAIVTIPPQQKVHSEFDAIKELQKVRARLQ